MLASARRAAGRKAAPLRPLPARVPRPARPLPATPLPRRSASSWTITDYVAGGRAAGFHDLMPPGTAVTLALLGAYPFVHFALLLAPHERREELVRAHNAVVRALGSAAGCDTSSLKVHSPRDASRWLQTYAAVILSFMSAVHWGAVTARAVKGAGTPSLLASIVPAIAAWAALNTSPDVNPPREGRDDADRADVVPEALRGVVSASPSDLHFPSSMSVLAAGFVWVLAQDMAAVAAGRLPPWYATYRVLLTVIVTSSLKLADIGLEGGEMPAALRAAAERAAAGAAATEAGDRERR